MSWIYSLLVILCIIAIIVLLVLFIVRWALKKPKKWLGLSALFCFCGVIFFSILGSFASLAEMSPAQRNAYYAELAREQRARNEDASQAAEAVAGTVAPEIKPTPTPAPTPTLAPTPTPQRDVFAVGDAAELKNVIVTLKSVTESDGGNYLSPQDGYVFVLCAFEIENNSDKEIAISSLVSFEAYVDDYSTNMSLTATMSRDSGEQLDGKIAPGKKMAGIIGYEVPEDWKKLEVYITPDFWGSKKIKFMAEND